MPNPAPLPLPPQPGVDPCSAGPLKCPAKPKMRRNARGTSPSANNREIDRRAAVGLADALVAFIGRMIGQEERLIGIRSHQLCAAVVHQHVATTKALH